MIHHGDCIEVMAQLPEGSVDAIVTDPPYGLEFMGKEWDRLDNHGQVKHDGPAEVAGGERGQYGKVSYFGSANRKCRICGHWEWSGTPCRCATPDFPNKNARQAELMQQWHHQWATAALRVAKPGAYLLAFGGTRTFHRLACAIEDAGWIIRDTLVWGYATGFPKGRANLKPAWEPIVMARKPGPLRPLAIDECRIPSGDNGSAGWYETTGSGPKFTGNAYNNGKVYEGKDTEPEPSPLGRWPANVVLTDPIFDGGIEGVVGGGETGLAGVAVRHRSGGKTFGGDSDKPPMDDMTYGDTGTYSRFFLIPKSARSDREPNDYGKLVGGLEESERDQNGSPVRNARCAKCGRVRFAAVDSRCSCAEPEWMPSSSGRQNSHPTVKPTELMRHLVRLVTPAGGMVLDPFLGSGTTAIAAEQEGFAWIGIEREAEYVKIAEARLAGVQRGLGLDVPAPVSAPSTAKGHWPKERGKGGDGYGFKGQTELDERYEDESA